MTPTTRARLTRRLGKGMRRTYLPGEEEEPLLCLDPTTRMRLTRRPRKAMTRTYLPGEEE